MISIAEDCEELLGGGIFKGPTENHANEKFRSEAPILRVREQWGEIPLQEYPSDEKRLNRLKLRNLRCFLLEI